MPDHVPHESPAVDPLLEIKRPTFDEAVEKLKISGRHAFLTKGKQKSVNGEADGLAIGKDPLIEIIHSTHPYTTHIAKLSGWMGLVKRNPNLNDIAVVSTPDNGCDLFYQCAENEARTLWAGDEAGFPIIETQTFAVTYPTPGYELIQGHLTTLPTITPTERKELRSALTLLDKRPTVQDLVNALEADMPKPRRTPAQRETPDYGNIIGAAFPDINVEVTDENLRLIFENMKVSEDNIGRAFEARYKTELRYCDAWGQWLQWNESKWEVEKTLLAFDCIRNLTRTLNTSGTEKAAKASFSRGVETFCRAARTFATLPAQWDRNPWLLNDPAQTTNLSEIESHDHVRQDYITKCTRVSPSDGPHPVFDMFLRDICLADEGLMQYHQRSLGACLSGAIQDNFLLFWYGTGQNGKNTFGDLIAWILGDYAKVIPIETLISNKNQSHPTTLANLRGLRLAVCSEVSEGSYWDEARVKSLTGDTEISARFMRQDFFEFPRTHKHLVYGNHRPMLRIVDPGMQSRLHIVPFKAYFPPDARDPQMRRKLEAEAPQILSWLVAGHTQWLEDGYLKKCSAVQAETDSYFQAQSTNEMWLEECCNEDPDYRTPAKELYSSYKTWKESRGEGVTSMTRWGEWMSTRYEKMVSSGQAIYRGLSVRQTIGSYLA